ncbi:MAG: SDR family NAD(P)-dependent oxidoreductase [Pseudomonadota bacterium]
MTPAYNHALIVGAGSGLSASLARLFHERGLKISLAARAPDSLSDLALETSAQVFKSDASWRGNVEQLFDELDVSMFGAPDVVVYNPSARVRGPVTDLDPDAVEAAIRVTAFGAFLVAQQSAKRMIPNGHGAILFTGASAAYKGYPQSSSFAMGKFAQRGLAQSLARELHPQGVHVGHVNIDGGIANPTRPDRLSDPNRPDAMLDPDAIARTYWHLLEQDRSAWSWEIDVRPWTETF